MINVLVIKIVRSITCSIKYLQIINVVGALKYYSYSYKSVSCVRVMVFNVTFNNILVISWRSVLLMDETGVPGENHRPAVTSSVPLRGTFLVSVVSRHASGSEEKVGTGKSLQHTDLQTNGLWTLFHQKSSI
jgi:hypothetical protein